MEISISIAKDFQSKTKQTTIFHSNPLSAPSSGISGSKNLAKGDFNINHFHLRNCTIIYEHTAAIWLLDEALFAASFFGWDNYIHTFFIQLDGNKK